MEQPAVGAQALPAHGATLLQRPASHPQCLAHIKSGLRCAVQSTAVRVSNSTSAVGTISVDPHAGRKKASAAARHKDLPVVLSHAGKQRRGPPAVCQRVPADEVEHLAICQLCQPADQQMAQMDARYQRSAGATGPAQAAAASQLSRRRPEACNAAWHAAVAGVLRPQARVLTEP